MTKYIGFYLRVCDAVPDNIGLEMEYKPPKAPMELRFLFRWLSRDRKSSSEHLVVGGAIAIVMGVHLSCADSPTFASGLTRTPRSLNLDAARLRYTYQRPGPSSFAAAAYLLRTSGYCDAVSYEEIGFACEYSLPSPYFLNETKNLHLGYISDRFWLIFQ